MLIEIQSRNITLTQELKDLLRKRVEFAFDRFQHKIQKVRIRLSDVNGPKGGIDKHCQIHLALPDQPDVVVRTRASRIEAAISKTTSRSAIALYRRFKKRSKYASAKRLEMLEA